MVTITKDSYDLCAIRVSQLTEKIEQRLDQLLPNLGERDKVSQAMREGTLAPGKRIRPLLLLLVAQDLGYCGASDAIVDLACAVEIIHAASLILDDMPCMDDAQLRRNRPTLHRQFGEPVALLAVVALVSKAFNIIALTEGLRATAKNLAIAELSQAIGLQGLVQGQYQDIMQGSHSRSKEAILMTNHYKTSTLFGAALQIAAIVAQADEISREQLRHFSFNLGQAFQLLDDLTDDDATSGKDIGQDRGKSTVVNLLGATCVKKQLCDYLSSASQHLTNACPNSLFTDQFIDQWFSHKLASLT